MTRLWNFDVAQLWGCSMGPQAETKWKALNALSHSKKFQCKIISALWKKSILRILWSHISPVWIHLLQLFIKPQSCFFLKEVELLSYFACLGEPLDVRSILSHWTGPVQSTLWPAFWPTRLILFVFTSGIQAALVFLPRRITPIKNYVDRSIERWSDANRNVVWK